MEHSSPTLAKENSGQSAILQLMVAAIAFATIPIFSSFLAELEVSSFQQAFLRILGAIFFAAILLKFSGKTQLLIPKRDNIKFPVLLGLFLALMVFLYLSAVAVGTPVTEVILLVYTQPAFTILFARLLLKERITSRRLISVFLSILGVCITLEIWAMEEFAQFLLGDIFSLLNGIFFSAYILVGRKYGQKNNEDLNRITFWSFGFAFIWLIPLGLVMTFMTSDPRLIQLTFSIPPEAWLLILGMAILGTIVPYGLLNIAVTKVSASRAGVLLLLEPVAVAVMSALFLGDIISVWHLIGGILILCGVWMTVTESEFE